VQPEHRRYAYGQVYVGAALRQPELQKCIDSRHAGP
jgi:hypothetical protein